MAGLGFESQLLRAAFGLGELAVYNIEGEHLGRSQLKKSIEKLGGVGQDVLVGESISLTRCNWRHVAAIAKNEIL